MSVNDVLPFPCLDVPRIYLIYYWCRSEEEIRGASSSQYLSIMFVLYRFSGGVEDVHLRKGIRENSLRLPSFFEPLSLCVISNLLGWEGWLSAVGWSTSKVI